MPSLIALLFLRQCLWLNPGFKDTVRLAGQQAPGILLSAFPGLGSQTHHDQNFTYSKMLNSGPHACTANTLLTKSSPQPLELFLKIQHTHSVLIKNNCVLCCSFFSLC